MKFPLKIFTVYAILHDGYLDTGSSKLPVILSDYPHIPAYWEVEIEPSGFRIVNFIKPNPIEERPPIGTHSV